MAQEIRRDDDSLRAFRGSTSAALSARFAQGTLPAVAAQALANFLADYGHRAVAEIDLGMPRWSDDPEHILGALANYLRLEDPRFAPDAVFARGAREAEAMVETLAQRARQRGPLRGGLVAWALGRARRLAGLREIPKYYAVAALTEVRRSLAVVGAGLARRGKLETRDDIFFLELAEARDALRGADLRSLVKERRQAYETELHRRHIPRLILSDGTEPEALATATAAEDGALLGTAASAGSVTAQARVILDPVGARIEPGEILVAPSTDPGWTPLFLTAGGLVMEMGGANSHGAVVAREYGIPAVVGVPGATRHIRSGQTIRVDGSKGLVAVELAPSGRR
jgi:pyruvate,water dikinase